MLPTNSRRSARTVVRDVWWGICGVAPFAAFFGGLSLVGELLGVRFPGFTIGSTIIVYIALGLVTGIAIGLLKPVALTLWGTGVIGAIVGIFVAIYVRVLAHGWSGWSAPEFIFFIVVMGGCAFCANGFRRGYLRAQAKSLGNPSTE